MNTSLWRSDHNLLLFYARSKRFRKLQPNSAAYLSFFAAKRGLEVVAPMGVNYLVFLSSDEFNLFGSYSPSLATSKLGNSLEDTPPLGAGSFIFI